MAMRTARQKAALRKAQLASARKRRKGNVSREKVRRKKAAKAYRGPGSTHKLYSDYGNSRGLYSRGRSGKKIGKARRIYRKTGYYASYAHPLQAGILLASKARGKRAAKKR